MFNTYESILFLSLEWNTSPTRQKVIKQILWIVDDHFETVPPSITLGQFLDQIQPMLGGLIIDKDTKTTIKEHLCYLIGSKQGE